MIWQNQSSFLQLDWALEYLRFRLALDDKEQKLFSYKPTCVVPQPVTIQSVPSSVSSIWAGRATGWTQSFSSNDSESYELGKLTNDKMPRAIK